MDVVASEADAASDALVAFVNAAGAVVSETVGAVVSDVQLDAWFGPGPLSLTPWMRNV